jgi:putative heme-binding domain-containing protein
MLTTDSILFLALAALFPLAPRAQAQFVTAPEPPSGVSSPVTGAEQVKRFSLPPGFEIELFASEEQGAGKAITVAWDDSGRLWTMTALEYPLDGNEQPETAKALYEKGGRDKVLVFDEPYGRGPRQAHVFADGLAMPMGLLPYKDGALVGQGPDVFWMHDTNGDGHADTREKILTGFGVQDSHLMPHQFTRAPGGWFYLAQGAFNYSKVLTRDGRVHQFDQTRLARFTVDGMRFEDLTSGPCNIWGLVIRRDGETFIQEANDYGYPVMLYQEGASYPGCSGSYKPYAPYFPSEVEFRMGGTGLSGLALSDPGGSFPGAYADVMYVANPITRKVQAIKIHADGPRFRYELLGDFVLCSDEWFRPVSIHFGPDGCLYIVDWYNKIISHNEVPRNHPERDKTRGRIWRVRHKDQPAANVPNLAKAADGELLKYLLQSESTWEMRGAWHQIVDRGLNDLAPDLKKFTENRAAEPAHRIQALWTLEDLHALQLGTIRAFLAETNRNFRREALRALATVAPPAAEALPILTEFKNDPDPEVRAEAIRRLIGYASTNNAALTMLVGTIQPSLDQPMGKSPHSGAPMKLREAYDREFERYLVRASLEKIPARLTAFLRTPPAQKLPVDSQLLLALALPNTESADTLARLLPKIERVPNEEELLRLVETLDSPESKTALQQILAKPDARRVALQALLKVRNRLDPAKLAPLLGAALKGMWEAPGEDRAFVARVAGAFRVEAVADQLNTSLKSDVPPAVQAAALRALREINKGDPQNFATLARNSKDRTVRDEALNSLAAAKSATPLILELWPEMNAIQHRTALRQLTQDDKSATALLAAAKTGTVHERELDAESLERIRQVLPKETDAQALVERLSAEFKPVLRLDGRKESYVDSNITLEGPFTVETWIRLDEGISNSDGILGFGGSADFNFAGGIFRVYCGRDLGDRVIARRPMSPNAWTHLAVTRDSKGVFRLYINGEIDVTDPRPVTATFTDLDIGRTSPTAGGTAADLTEFRVWNLARTPEEIRNDFDRTFAGEPLPSGLVHYYPGSGPWGALKGGAHVEKVPDAPALLNSEQARALVGKFAKYRAMANDSGDFEKGKTIFKSTCAVCHSVNGQGGQIGPVLNGAAANGLETLLRAVITPNAAMEAGYRTFRIELKDGDTLDGFLVTQDKNTILLRQPNVEDQRIAKEKVRQAGFTQKSLMPEGLLEAMPEPDVRDLFAFLKTLK